MPVIIDKYLPVEDTDAAYSELFKICYKILDSGRFEVESTQQLVVSTIIKFAEGEDEIKQLLQWFNHASGDIIGSKGQVLQQLTLK